MKRCLVILVVAFAFCGCQKNTETQTFDLETCRLRLKMIEHAKQLWAEKNQKTTNDTPAWDDLHPYLRGGAPECPNGGVYTIGRVGEAPGCSIPEHTKYFKKSSG
jgi:hypothetical protein